MNMHKIAFRKHEEHDYKILIMSFGLANVLETLWSFMFDIYRPYLHNFILIPFDNILIYSKEFLQHLEPLKTRFRFYAKSTLSEEIEWTFGADKIEYLGQSISKHEASPSSWRLRLCCTGPLLLPSSNCVGLQALQVTKRWFIKNYGLISWLFTDFFKQDNFKWTNETTNALINSNKAYLLKKKKLKQGMTSAPMLALRDLFRLIQSWDQCLWSSNLGQGIQFHK